MVEEGEGMGMVHVCTAVGRAEMHDAARAARVSESFMMESLWCLVCEDDVSVK